MLSVRPASHSDLDTLVGYSVALARESEGKALDPAVVTPGIRAILEDPHKGRFFVAEMAGEPAGQTLVTYEWSDWRGGWIWWIQSVFVASEARRRGVFRRLLGEVSKRGEEEGVVALRLYVDTGNEGARAVYERLGFSGTDYVVLEKDSSYLG